MWRLYEAAKTARESASEYVSTVQVKAQSIVQTVQSEAEVLLHAIGTARTGPVDEILYEEIEDYKAFMATFSMESHTEEIAAILETDEEIKLLHEEMVPEQLSFEEFWSRFFFREHMETVRLDEEAKAKAKRDAERAASAIVEEQEQGDELDHEALQHQQDYAIVDDDDDDEFEKPPMDPAIEAAIAQEDALDAEDDDDHQEEGDDTLSQMGMGLPEAEKAHEEAAQWKDKALELQKKLTQLKAERDQLVASYEEKYQSLCDTFEAKMAEITVQIDAAKANGYEEGIGESEQIASVVRLQAEEEIKKLKDELAEKQSELARKESEIVVLKQVQEHAQAQLPQTQPEVSSPTEVNSSSTQTPASEVLKRLNQYLSSEFLVKVLDLESAAEARYVAISKGSKLFEDEQVGLLVEMLLSSVDEAVEKSRQLATKAAEVEIAGLHQEKLNLFTFLEEEKHRAHKSKKQVDALEDILQKQTLELEQIRLDKEDMKEREAQHTSAQSKQLQELREQIQALTQQLQESEQSHTEQQAKWQEMEQSQQQALSQLEASLKETESKLVQAQEETQQLQQQLLQLQQQQYNSTDSSSEINSNVSSSAGASGDGEKSPEEIKKEIDLWRMRAIKMKKMKDATDQELKATQEQVLALQQQLSVQPATGSVPSSAVTTSSEDSNNSSKTQQEMHQALEQIHQLTKSLKQQEAHNQQLMQQVKAFEAEKQKAFATGFEQAQAKASALISELQNQMTKLTEDQQQEAAKLREEITQLQQSSAAQFDKGFAKGQDKMKQELGLLKAELAVLREQSLNSISSSTSDKTSGAAGSAPNSFATPPGTNATVDSTVFKEDTWGDDTNLDGGDETRDDWGEW